MNDEAWLQSDGAIINRAQKTPHNEGVMWSVVLPDGDSFGAVLVNTKASSVSQFCEMVRTEWNERKEESEAKARRATIAKDSVPNPPEESSKEAIPTTQDAPSFEESLREQLARTEKSIGRLTTALEDQIKIQVALTAALGAIDEPQDDSKTSRGLFK